MHSTAKVTRVTSTGVYVELPGNPGFSYGPCVSTVTQVKAGDTVVVVPCDENDPEAMAVVGVTPPPPPPPVGVTMADVNARLAALGLSAGTAGALAEAKAYAAQQATQALTDGKAYTDGKVAPLATTAALNTAVAPLATTAALNTAVAPLATTAAMTTGDTNTLASSKAYTDGKVAPLATTAALDLSNLLHNNRLDALEAATPAGSAYKMTAQTIPTATTLVTFDGTRATSGGVTLDAGALRVNTAGWYQVSASLTFSASTSAARRILYLAADKPSAARDFFATSVISAAATTTLTSTVSVSMAYYAPAGTVLGAYANAGTAWSLDVSSWANNNLSAVRIGP